MSIKKVTLASLILFSLTACSGGSGGNSSNTTKPQPTQQITQQKAQVEQKEKEKAEAERLAAEKAAKEKAEAERLAAEKENLDTIKGINSSNFTMGFNRNPEKDYYYSDGNGYIEGRAQELYNQKYSVVFFDTNWTYKNLWENGQYVSQNTLEHTVTTKGSKPDALPNMGKATYTGVAFDRNFANDDGGKLIYTVNFDDRTGSGRVENQFGIGYELTQGNISTENTISSKAIKKENAFSNKEGLYSLEFFGPQAEEIGGKMEFLYEFIGSPSYNETYGLSGTRGEIQK